jgi:hypothetical protein
MVFPEFPQRLDVEITVVSFDANVISWVEICMLMENLGKLFLCPADTSGEAFSFTSEDVSRLAAFEGAVMAFLDAFYMAYGESLEHAKNSFIWQIIGKHPHHKPARLVLKLITNGLRPHSPLFNFINSFLAQIGLGLFFEAFEGGTLIFVQDRENLAFFTKFTSAEFVDVLIEQQDLQIHGPSSYFTTIFQDFALRSDLEKCSSARL